MEPTAEQINEFYDYFISIYDENGNEINPIPENKNITVWCQDHKGDEEGFAYNVTFNEMGLELFIAQSWIPQDILDSLIKTYGTK